MRQVIKIGGTLLEDASSRERMAALLAREFAFGGNLLAVHGGGKQLTAHLERSGIASQFVNGLRVTSAEALDGVVEIFAGAVNHKLLAALYAAGVPSVGISGIDGGCLLAKKLHGEHGEDWGFVGDITKADPRVWEALLAANYLPVLACVAVGAGGQIYNVNADQAAVACAVHWRADRLVFLTDVDGVRGPDGKMLAELSSEQIPELIRSGAVTGGMLAKLRAVEEAMAGGIANVCIANGRSVTANAKRGGIEAGTVIISSLAAAKKA